MTRWIACCIAASLLCACRGSGGGESFVDLQGLWRGTVSASPTEQLTCMIHKGGPMACYPADASQYVLPGVTGVESPFQDLGLVSPSANGGYGSFNAPYVGLQAQGSGDASGISGQFQYSFHIGGPGCDCTDTVTEAFSMHPYQAMPGTATIQSGQWTGFYPGNALPSPTADITVATNGAFHGSDAYGETLTGALWPVAGEPDLFAVAMTLSSNCGVPSCQHDYTGLAYESASDDLHLFPGAPGPYYYMIISATDSATLPRASLLVFRAL